MSYVAIISILYGSALLPYWSDIFDRQTKQIVSKINLIGMWWKDYARSSFLIDIFWMSPYGFSKVQLYLSRNIIEVQLRSQKIIENNPNQGHWKESFWRLPLSDCVLYSTIKPKERNNKAFLSVVRIDFRPGDINLY